MRGVTLCAPAQSRRLWRAQRTTAGKLSTAAREALRGQHDSIGRRFAAAREVFPPLPRTPYEDRDKQATRVSSLSPVRHRGNDYSVPVEYGHREVVVKGYVHELAIHCEPQKVAPHRRSHEKHDAIYEPRPYLPVRPAQN
jgi:hypothetical protein